MKELLTYLAEVIACSAALLAAYALLLERRVRFGWCRRYLTALLPLAALIQRAGLIAAGLERLRRVVDVFRLHPALGLFDVRRLG